MLFHPGHQIGDPWFFIEGDVAHCFYLVCPLDASALDSKEIGHATSTDLVNWHIHPLALRRGAPDSYDGASLATGSVIRAQGKYWMSYTGNHAGPDPCAALATSDDLFAWHKAAWNPITRLDERFYQRTGNAPRAIEHWRDPFLFEHDDYFYQAICANRADGPTDARGTVGLARSRDLRVWETLPPLEVQPVASELEVPQIRQVNGLYYLIFCLAPAWWSAPWRARHPDKITSWSTYTMVGPSPLGPFVLRNPNPIVPPDYPVQPYAGQIVEWQGHHYLMGKIKVPENNGNAVCDPIEVAFDADGVRALR